MSARHPSLPASASHFGKQAGNETAHPCPLSTENIGQRQRIIGTTETSQRPSDCFDWHDQDGNGPLTLAAFRFDAPACVAGGAAATATEPSRWPTIEDWWPPVEADRPSVRGALWDTIWGGVR